MDLCFFHAPASSSVPLFLSLSHHLFHLLSHVIISPLQTSYPCLQSVPSHPGSCPFLKMRLNLANSASIGWPVAQPPRRWGTLLCKSRSCPTATGKPTQLTSCITWPPGLLTGTRTHAYTHSCSGWYVTLWICGTSYIDSLKCNILFFLLHFSNQKLKRKSDFSNSLSQLQMSAWLATGQVAVFVTDPEKVTVCGDKKYHAGGWILHWSQRQEWHV